MKTTSEATANFRCSLDRAFKTPILGDATKILTGYGIIPISEEKTLASSSWILKNGIQLGLVKKGEKLSIEVIVKLSGSQYFKILKGDSIVLRFNNAGVKTF